MSVPIHSMADGEGFEPSAQIHGQRLSRAPLSTAQPTVQVERHTGCAPVPMPWKGIMLLLHQWRNLLWFTLFSSHSGLFLLWVCLLGHDSQKGALVYPSVDEPGPFRWVNAEEQSRLYP